MKSLDSFTYPKNLHTQFHAENQGKSIEAPKAIYKEKRT